MAWFRNFSVFVLLLVVVAGWGWERCEGSGKFGFDVHHVLSDPVKEFLGIDGLLPAKGTLEYYKMLANLDHLRGRRLVSNNVQTTVTFATGNETLRLSNLAYLDYANVTVGTPAKWFLVALDTGSDLFWLPCDCGTTCVRDLKQQIGRSFPLNIYSPNASSTSSKVTCNNTLCFQADQCPSDLSECPYHTQYLSNGTSSSGVLVEDVLHLVTEDVKAEAIEAQIVFGCGQNLTGGFQKTGGVNGLIGLGLQNYSVPSMLAKAGIASNSFSMCFGGALPGRISFGDKGSSDQQETPLLRSSQNPTYIVNVTQINVGGDATNASFPALFHSGAAFTHLLEPAYTAFTKKFNALVKDKRHPKDPNFPFEFCYDLRPNATLISYPRIEVVMEGDAILSPRSPLFVVGLGGGKIMYCLAVLKSQFKINIIGQNFMIGYRVVFDRERMVLGLKESNCYDDSSASSPESLPPPPEAAPPQQSPLPSVQSPTAVTTRVRGASPRLNPLSSALFILVAPILAFF